MALSSSTILSIVELAVYLPLAALTVYLLIRHRRPGFLGNAYLLAFIGLRLATDGIQIADRNKPISSAAAILNSIGTSPLLLALAGFLHESSHYLNPNPNNLLDTKFQGFFHIATVVGLVLAAIGGSSLGKPQTDKNNYANDHKKQEAGSVILFAVWILMCLYAFSIHRMTRQSAPAGASVKARASASRMLTLTVASAPFIGVRALYGIIYSFDHSPSVSPVKGTFAVRFVLIFLVQLLAVAGLIVGGVLSRHIVTEAQEVPAGHRGQGSPNELGVFLGPDGYQIQGTRK